MAENDSRYCFRGFYYVEDDSKSPIDKSLSYSGKLTSGTTETDYSYKDLEEKFSNPVLLTHVSEAVSQKFLVEDPEPNSAQYSASAIQTEAGVDGDTGKPWCWIFNILYRVYQSFNANISVTSQQLDNYITGVSTETNFSSVDVKETYGYNYKGTTISYVKGSMNIDVAPNAPSYLGSISFQFNYNGNTYTIEAYCDINMCMAQTFGTDTVSIYYNKTGLIDNANEVTEVTKLFGMLGSPYKGFYHHVTEEGGSGKIIFHIFTKSTDLSGVTITNLATYPNVLKAIQDAIAENEPVLYASPSDRKVKYPHIFGDDIRIIYPLYDRYDLGNNEYATSQDMKLPISFAEFSRIVNKISGMYSSLLYDAENPSFSPTPGTYEFFIQNNPWMPYIVAGTNGGISDMIPLQRPYIDGELSANASANGKFARQFYEKLDKCIHYICGGVEQLPEGMDEDELYVQFMVHDVRWYVYKDNYSTAGYVKMKDSVSENKLIIAYGAGD